MDVRKITGTMPNFENALLRILFYRLVWQRPGVIGISFYERSTPADTKKDSTQAALKAVCPITLLLHIRHRPSKAYQKW